jgi:gamma-butyrobetaine dioxygenase
LDTVDEIIDLFARRGQAEYFGEPVSQAEHALQAARLAVEAGAEEPLIAAALLHDLGHLLHGLDEDIADEGLDARHEEAGEAWLASHFGPEVTEPIRLHVAAKRYLCAVEPGYRESLSPASQQSLALQGGPFTGAEVAAFERNPHHAAAVRLRLWDDLAKVPGLAVPGVEQYRELLVRLLKP